MKAYKERLGVLQQAVVSTEENMAFLEMYLAKEELFDKEGQREMYDASLMLFTPFTVVFHLKISVPLLREIIENMYSVDRADVSRDIENDALGELLNTIAVQVMQRVNIEQVGGCWNIGSLDTELAEMAEHSVTCNFEYQGNGLTVIWEIPQ